MPQILDPVGQLVAEKRDREGGLITFTTTIPGQYNFCFLDVPIQSLPTQNRVVTLQTQTGAEAKDYSNAASKVALGSRCTGSH